MSDVKQRQKMLALIEKERSSDCILYVTGDRRNAETKIHSEVIELFCDHLDSIGHTSRLSLIMYTNGGQTAAAWRLTNLLKSYCDDFEVIVISKALSAGTLISLGANRIVMTKQAVLGPIDPSLDHALNPQKPGAKAGSTVPVSVEAIRGYLETLRTELGIQDQVNLSKVMSGLSEKIHPLVLGQVFRSQSQIRTIASKLLSSNIEDQEIIDKIVNFVCERSGSHDYAINRVEAQALGLNVEFTSDKLYSYLIDLHHNYMDNLKMLSPFDPSVEVGPFVRREYSLCRALIESRKGGSHQYIREGMLARKLVVSDELGTNDKIDDTVTFNSWRKVL